MKHKHFTFLLALLMSMATSSALALGTDGDIEIDGLYYRFHENEAMVTEIKTYGFQGPVIPNPLWGGVYPTEVYPDKSGLYYYYINWYDFVDWKTITKDDDEWNKYIDEEGNPTTGWGEYDGDDLIEIHVPLLRDEEGNPMDAVDDDGNLLFYEVTDTVYYDYFDYWHWDNLVRCTLDENGRIKKYVSQSLAYPINKWYYMQLFGGVWPDEAPSGSLPSQITYNGVTYTVTGIAEGAFSYSDLCYGFDLVIPESIKYIGQYALDGFGDFRDSIYAGKVAYHSDGSGVIKEGTIGIASHYNWYETNETSITIPASVVIIGSHAFDNDNLTSVTVAWETPINPKYWGDSDDYNPFPYASNATLYVPKGTKAAYEAAPYWKDFKEIVEIREEIDLADGSGFTNNEEKEKDEIRYTRNYTNTEWQALYVPYALNYEDWQADFDIARLNNANQYDDDEDGTVDRTVLESFYVKSGKTMANTPYLIRAKEAGEKTIVTENATLCKAEERSIDCSSIGTLFTFTGTYSGIPGTEMFTNGYYAMGSGSLHQAESSANDLSPYRWYMKVTDCEGNPKNLGEVKIQVFGEDGTDGLTSTLSQGEEEGAVFDLSGRRMEKPTKKGMYIRNGRKVIVR